MKTIACSDVISRQSVISINCLAARKYLYLHDGVSQPQTYGISHIRQEIIKAAKRGPKWVNLVFLVDRTYRTNSPRHLFGEN